MVNGIVTYFESEFPLFHVHDTRIYTSKASVTYCSCYIWRLVGEKMPQHFKFPCLLTDVQTSVSRYYVFFKRDSWFHVNSQCVPVTLQQTPALVPLGTSHEASMLMSQNSWYMASHNEQLTTCVCKKWGICMLKLQNLKWYWRTL